MTLTFRSLLVLSLAFAGIGPAVAQPSRDPRIADLVQAGKIRIGLFSSQYTKDAATGELKGVRPDMARALAARIGIPVVFVEHRGPPAVIECLKTGACDVVFLPRDERVASVGAFTAPFIKSEFTLLVPIGSSIRVASDANRPEIRIAVVKSHASTASLVAAMTKAVVMQRDNEAAAFELLRAGGADAFASTRQLLGRMSVGLPGSRVLADHYGAQLNRVVVPKGHAGWLAYAGEFVEDAKASGVVQKAIDREGTSVFEVAAPGDSQ